MLVAVGVLGEGGAGGKSPPAALEHQARLRLDRTLPCQCALPHHHVEHGHAVLMREKGGEDEVGGGLSGDQVGANARNEDSHICSNLVIVQKVSLNVRFYGNFWVLFGIHDSQLKFIKIWERDCRAHTHKYSVVKLIKFGIFK